MAFPLRHHLPFGRLVCGAALVAAASCSSTSRFEAPRGQLSAALQGIDTEQYAAAHETLETLIGETQADATGFALQRFFAFYLDAQIHLRASLTQPFFDEPLDAQNPFGNALQHRARTSNDHPEAHILACLYALTMAEMHAVDAGRSPILDDETALLPPLLENLSPGTDALDSVRVAFENLQLIKNTCYTRLGFARKVRRYLLDAEALVAATPGMATEELDRLGVIAEQRPWVFFMVFEFLRKDPDKYYETYLFGVEALEGSDVYGYDLPDAQQEAIVRWVELESLNEFFCPDTGEVFDPGKRRSSSGRHRKQFQQRARS